MAYFVVRDGAIDEAFESLDEATANANERPGARVIGDEWVTLASAKDRVRQALAAIDEIAPLLRAEEGRGDEGPVAAAAGNDRLGPRPTRPARMTHLDFSAKAQPRHPQRLPFDQISLFR